MTHPCNVVNAGGHIFEPGLPRSNSRGGFGERRTLDFGFQSRVVKKQKRSRNQSVMRDAAARCITVPHRTFKSTGGARIMKLSSVR